MHNVFVYACDVIFAISL